MPVDVVAVELDVLDALELVVLPVVEDEEPVVADDDLVVPVVVVGAPPEPPSPPEPVVSSPQAANRAIKLMAGSARMRRIGTS
jgi:hypothetical protein